MKGGLCAGRTECYSVWTDWQSVLRYALHRRTDWQSVLRLLGVLLFVAGPSGSAAIEVVRAEIGKQTAWTGEAVPLVITLYSPGPFSGTASFDLPELPRTAFLKAGNPMVGTQVVDGESYLTQRHEFAVYTQGAGEIVIPAFRVRFSGKATFLSAPEPQEGFTSELRFQSKRPPGTSQLGVVVVAKDMAVTQNWKPAAIETVQAGDVIERTISRRASATTAMMLAPVSAEALEGVRVYVADPSIQDRTERGESRAERIDTIKYQFERPGTFPLPDVSLVWWDLQASELQRETLPGETVTVEGPVEAAATEPQSSSGRRPVTLLLLLLAISVATWQGRKLIRSFVTGWPARRNNPEAVAAKQVLSACRAGNAPAAYAALIQWKRAASTGDWEASLDRLLPADLAADLLGEWSVLSRSMFSVEANETPWSGQRLAATFVRARRRLNQTTRTRRAGFALPALNPTTLTIGSDTIKGRFYKPKMEREPSRSA